MPLQVVKIKCTTKKVVDSGGVLNERCQRRMPKYITMSEY
jgi:hypothetical protein